MNQTFHELMDYFDSLYDKGYMFIRVEDVYVREPYGRGQLETSIIHKTVLLDGRELTRDELERAFNFVAFRKSIKHKDGAPLRLF